MKHNVWIILMILPILLCACFSAPIETPPTETTAPIIESTPGDATAIPTTEVTVSVTADVTAPPITETTVPLHSDLYIPDVPVEAVLQYFNEVVLAAEFVNGGDPSRVQKWVDSILFTVSGDYTELDWARLMSFCSWLNTIEGFPGMYEAENPQEANLDIHFCTGEEIPQILGDHFRDMDGGVTFWYDGMDQIYNATICYRNDIGQYTRNSVILEEIYNGLGPVQDTNIREDSICYSGFSEPQSLTEIDELILRLLYHPDILCGMNAEECEAVIRNLYY